MCQISGYTRYSHVTEHKAQCDGAMRMSTYNLADSKHANYVPKVHKGSLLVLDSRLYVYSHPYPPGETKAHKTAAQGCAAVRTMIPLTKMMMRIQ